MACYSPLKAFPVGKHDSGSTKYKVVSFLHEFVVNDYGIKVDNPIKIPCGKCIGCRLSYSREWANRMMLEQTYHEESWFLTLTYDDLHLPLNDYINVETGEITQSPIHTVDKQDMQLFMKRLRKNSGQDLRFYGVGEYGDLNHRPHYHIIVFGLHLDDIYEIRKNKKGHNLYYSKLLDKCWKKGIINAAEVNWDTCAYVARYVTKKMKGKESKQIYEYFNIEPPFALMSRRPGIGKNYFDDNADYFYKYDKICLETSRRGYEFKPP